MLPFILGLIYLHNKGHLSLLCFMFSQYKWSAKDQAGMTFNLDESATCTGSHCSKLVVHSDVLDSRKSYTFTLNVSQPGRGRWGSASLTILPNNPPHGGTCELSPQSDIRGLETVVTFKCSGTLWCFTSLTVLVSLSV